MREDADVELSAPLDRLARDDTSRFNRLSADATPFERLNPEFAKRDIIAAGRVTFYGT